MLRLVILTLALFMTSTIAHATVNIVVNTYDGIVVAADSRVTFTANGMSRILSDYGEKVVRVGSHALVTFSGSAYLLDEESQLRSIGSIISQFKSDSEINDTSWIDPAGLVHSIDSLLTELYNKQLRNALVGPLNVVVCGIDRGTEHRMYDLGFPIVKKDWLDRMKRLAETDQLKAKASLMAFIGEFVLTPEVIDGIKYLRSTGQVDPIALIDIAVGEGGLLLKKYRGRGIPFFGSAVVVG